MYILFFQVILLLLPSSSFALPAQPILTLGSITTSNNTLNAILGPDWDPRFGVQVLYQEVPIDEDQCLVEAVQVLGEWALMSPNDPVVEAAYSDEHLPNIGITALGPGQGRPVLVRFLNGGLYLGVQAMIEHRSFKKALFVIRWDGQLVGSIHIGAPGSRLSLSGDNSTNNIRQRSSSDTLALVSSQGVNRNSSNLSVSDILGGRDVRVKLDKLSLGQPLPKYDAIMAFMTVVFSGASPTARKRIPYPGLTITSPPPFNARLRVWPERATSAMPYVNIRVVALVTRQIPAILLLQSRRWAEVKFQIEVDDVLVATCWLTKDEAGLEFGQSSVS